jgi:hypothetical protein
MGLDWYPEQKIVCIKEPHDLKHLPGNIITPKVGEIYTIKSVTNMHEGIYLELYEIDHPQIIAWHKNLFKPTQSHTLNMLKNLLIPIKEKKRIEEKV